MYLMMFTGRNMWHGYIKTSFLFPQYSRGDRGSTVVKVLCYKSEGRWLDPSWCHWILH